MSTRTQSGQPHYTGARAVRSAGRIECIICRCLNPDGHGDAFTFDSEEYADDKNGNPISWNTAMNRILNLYRMNSITRQEAIAKYHEIMSPESAGDYARIERESDEKIQRGEDLQISPYTTWHNHDGHRRPHLTEEGVRTVFQRPGQSVDSSAQPSGYSQNAGHAGPDQGQGRSSASYGRRR